MEDEFNELRRDISAFLLGMRQAVDRPYRARRDDRGADRERFTRTLLMVEEARIKFNSYTRFREDPTEEEWLEARDILLKFVNNFLHSDDVDPVVFDRPFRAVGVGSQRERYSKFIIDLVDNGANIADALFAFQRILEQTPFTHVRQPSLNFEDLERIVPRQQVAPAQFEIKRGRIVLSRKSPDRLKEDEGNIRAAYEHIVSQGTALINSLESSNCDRRLLDSVKELHCQIYAEENIVKVGLTSIACGLMCSQFERELPDALNAMFGTYTTSVSMYVSQFPEWEQFSQKVAVTNLDEDDIVDLDFAAADVVRVLEENPELSDPDVPRTIRFVREFLNRPGSSAKRAAFAMMRTIENLVSSIVRHSLSALNRTAEKVVEDVSTTASKVISALLGIALVGATGIGATAVNAGAPWVKQVTEIVQRQIEKIDGTSP